VVTGPTALVCRLHRALDGGVPSSRTLLSAGAETGQGFRYEESNIITGSPAVYGPVGDPLQNYAGRFSGHYVRPARPTTHSNCLASRKGRETTHEKQGE
jgi:hypothetical protein